MSLNRIERYVLHPNKIDKAIWDMYKKAEAQFWTVEEVDLSQDMNDWKKLTQNEQYFIKTVLAFFASADGVIADNCMDRFAMEFPRERDTLFLWFSGCHGKHSLGNVLELIKTYITDAQEQESAFEAIENMPFIKQKVEWAIKWMNSDADVATRLIAFACAEGIFFSGAFCAIFWLKKRSHARAYVLE